MRGDNSDLQGTYLCLYYVRVGGPLSIVPSLWCKLKICLSILVFSILITLSKNNKAEIPTRTCRTI